MSSQERLALRPRAKEFEPLEEGLASRYSVDVPVAWPSNGGYEVHPRAVW
jgi:hypothetical protein